MRMQKLLNTYPFLSEIPDELLSSIDLDVLYIPSPSECQLIHKLSQDLKKNVVVYKKDHICKGGHLCRVLQSASLTPEHLDTLNVVEELFAGKIVVAYEKPLKFAVV